MMQISPIDMCLSDNNATNVSEAVTCSSTVSTLVRLKLHSKVETVLLHVTASLTFVAFLSERLFHMSIGEICIIYRM